MVGERGVGAGETIIRIYWVKDKHIFKNDFRCLPTSSGVLAEVAKGKVCIPWCV